jgi:hypothetical protein
MGLIDTQLFFCYNTYTMKNYRYLGEDAEILGNRLDAARAARDNSKSGWARNYWNSAVERLLFQWHQLPILHDADAQMTLIPRWTVSHDWFDVDYAPGYGITERAYDKLFRENANLDTSWHAHREQRLAKAQ